MGWLVYYVNDRFREIYCVKKLPQEVSYELQELFGILFECLIGAGMGLNEEVFRRSK